MRVREVRVGGYRSLRSIQMPLGEVTVVVGANGSGKTNLYRAMQLLAAAAEGRFSRALAEEGGMPSALWAGERENRGRKRAPVRLDLAVQLDDVRYHLSCGLPIPDSSPTPTKFPLDPVIKEESIRYDDGGTKAELLARKEQSAWFCDAEGHRVTYPLALWQAESVLSQLGDPHRYPEVAAVRNALVAWRFYHQFRTDNASPLRRPHTAMRTPVLSHHGEDLPCALQTIIENGDDRALHEAVRDAFDGARLSIEVVGEALSIHLTAGGIRRSLDARELSDGMLRYLCLLAALLSPRPAPMVVLNEPETSLHATMMPPLARLIARAAEASQIWVTTHSRDLADAIQRETDAMVIGLEKVDGATQIA